jgi:hypothetical protein
MAEIETAPAITREIDIRWEMALYGRPTRYTNSEEIGLSLTKRFGRVDTALEEIAASLVTDGVWADERQGEDDSLETLTGETWAAIEKLLKGWAGRAPERRDRIRAARREGAAA